MPFVFGNLGDGLDADAIIGPVAEDAGGKKSIFGAEIDSVVSDFGAVSALPDDDRAFFAEGVFHPKTNRERDVAILDEERFDRGTAVTI